MQTRWGYFVGLKMIHHIIFSIRRFYPDELYYTMKRSENDSALQIL